MNSFLSKLLSLKETFTMALLMLAISSYSQSDIDNLIKGSKEDANFLVKGYATPALNTIGFGLGQGWYNTAKPHKLFGFDLTVTASGVYIPSSDFSYKVQNSDLKNLQVNVPPSTTTSIDAPTIFGTDKAPTYQVKDPTTGVPLPGQTVQGAPGVDLKGSGVGFVPIPMVQLGIGLPKSTDLKIRFFPSTGLGAGGKDGNVSMFGFGIMHDVKQYIPKVKSLPFDLSAFFGYTKLKFDAALDNSTTDPDAPGRRASFESSAITVQGLISKKISVLTLYGGLGYNFNSSSLAVVGKYNLGGTSGSVTNPIDISASQSGPRITAGLRLKFAIFTFHGDYTLQKYDALTVGFGFNVR